VERECKIRFYEEGDEKSIVELINLTIPSARYSMERWLWEYKNNPYGFLAAVAECDGRIVGHMGLFFLRLKVGDRIILGSQACDLGIHPEFRGKGLFLAIGKALMIKAGEQGVSLTYGFPNRPSYFGHLKYGWFDVAMVPILVSLSNTYKALGQKIYEKHKGLKIMDPLVKISSQLADYSFSKASHHKPWAIGRVETFQVSSVDERMDDFWKRAPKDYGVMIVKDQKYLKWRFLDRPDFRYRLFTAEKNSNIEGYIVVSAEESEHRRVGHIDDAFATNKEAAQNLMISAFDFFDATKVDMIETWMLKGSMWYDLLRERGFLPLHFIVPNEKRRLIVHINSKEFLRYYRSARKDWYVTYADSDYAGSHPSIS
jgi:GNAT superfamily N-acetyltransferase